MTRPIADFCETAATPRNPPHVLSLVRVISVSPCIWERGRCRRCFSTRWCGKRRLRRVVLALSGRACTERPQPDRQDPCPWESRAGDREQADIFLPCGKLSTNAIDLRKSAMIANDMDHRCECSGLALGPASSRLLPYEMARTNHGPKVRAASESTRQCIPGCTDNWFDSLPSLHHQSPCCVTNPSPLIPHQKCLGFGKLRGVIVLFLHCSSSDVEPFPPLLGLGAGLVWHIKCWIRNFCRTVTFSHS